MAKGLVQKATRRQALSYRRFAPNPIGVTSIAAINGRGAAAGRGASARANKKTKGRPAVVIVKAKGKKTRTYRGAAAQAYLRRHHKKHYERSDFGRLRLAFTTRSGERVSISPKATSRRTSDLAERVGRLSREDKKLERKIAAKKARRREIEYVAGARVYKSRAAYERARALLDKKERAARKRRGGKPTAAELRRAGKTLERGAKAKKRGRKTVSRRKSYRHDLSKLPMRAYHAKAHERIKGAPVIGISEEDVVVVPARRNGRRKGPRQKPIHKRMSESMARQRRRLQARWRRHLSKLSGPKLKKERIRYAVAMERFDIGAQKSRKAPGRRRHMSYSSWKGVQPASSGRKLSDIRKSRAKSKARRVREADKLKHLVRLEYRGHDMAKDRELRKIAKRYGGKDLGSGFDFSSGYRDMDFGFKTKREADKAEKSINRVRGVSTSARAHARRVLGSSTKARRNGHGEDMRANKKRGKRKLSGAAKAAHERRIASGKRPSKRTKKGHRRAPHSGKGLLSVKIGGKTFRTYMVKGKGGKVVHVPRYKLLGFKSERALQKVLQGSDEKKAERISKKLQAIYKKRAAAAERVKKHGDVFTPNARRKVGYEEWSENTMKANKRKGRKSGRKGHSKASRRAAARKAAETRKLKRAKRSAAARKAARTRKRHHAERSASARKSSKSTRRGKKKHAKKGKHRSRSAAGKARWRAMSAAKKAKVLAALRRGRAKARGGRKGSRKGYRKNHSTALANRGYASNSSRALANRRHHHHRRNGRKFTMNGFGESVKVALESGAIATAGFIAHRGVGWLLSEKLLSKIGVFADATTSTTGTAGSMAPYRRIVAGLVVGAGGIVLAEKAMPKQATMLAAGIVVSLLQQVIVTALGQVAPTYVPAVSGYGGYGDRSGRAFKVFPGGIGRPMGEYFLTGQNGYGRAPMGEYFLTGASGFGASERAGRRRIAQAGFGQPISQAAAGFGQPISQAAAGFGQPISQAAAGYGAAPMLSQAAAGVGEYFLTGANGIGEYEMVQPSGMSGAATVTDEGIQGGDTNAAERALNIAEGVAGVSDDNGIGVQSIVDPTDVAVPVNDEPGGSRAGILAGQEGIFGGAL